MIRFRRRLATAATATAALLLANTPATAASDPPPTVQQQIDVYLASVSGATQINASEVSFADGVVMSFISMSNSSIGADCPSGSYCVYDRLNYGYPRLRLAACGWQDLAPYAWNDRTESVHYNISKGSVSFINHGTRPDHSDDHVIFGVSATSRYLSDVSPYRNVADHVYHTC